MLVIDTSFPAKDFNERSGEPVGQVILHYTAAPFKSSLRTLTQNGVSAHYLLPDPDEPAYRAAGYDELRVFRLVGEDKRAWHAGASYWDGRDNLNSRAIGIEIVNLARDDKGVFTFPAYREEQVRVLIALVRDILERYPHIGPVDILGHSDVAYWRKSDPGPRLPWRCLHEAGIGAWFDETARAMYQRRFCMGLPPEVEVERAFQRYGYKPAWNRQAFEQRTRAFQMHFRAREYAGFLDAETCAILYALNEKYRGL
ncbi:N-acetylmuramoyl-L-alanine amidase [Pseudomonas fluorescens]|jgi:N-acetylmuramoyl-L-alanine amidase|uniref:N-acetylmuramoyl-L-alanine amidase n=1 Tax=Pseudomonas fluorescens TaxID=294 RepID=A0A2N1EDX6_PSEFL|nr:MULTISPECIES: N-acetylmuramoyl-L-alanine amidase [Pseudomonas]MBD8097889.1 N-acetylmuramoyl-L-alanine amidase [Pseudomonas fluorescens]MBD8773701.1 N-acetylmuramoyl-L-alanine amidase [Pseudomonas fluorescens]MBD8777948.1 N-acetylmuramoyl-L-alanine amidase [Pseudomonas fluorescens]MBD8793785.1 N-acetylmuramoyl-L-alanine amidase [Pseudomonas fluorescens]PKH25928.1 N-acetylmuramoyl-L-alanine amidase [Pseudomonas fluorescens]